jgi:hypothetical protein
MALLPAAAEAATLKAPAARCPHAAAYEDDSSTSPKFGEAIATFTVAVGYKLHQVDIFRLQEGRCEKGAGPALCLRRPPCLMGLAGWLAG